MRRLLLALGAAVLVTATFTGIAQAATGSDDCTTAAEATYQHVFDGPAGTVTITATKPLCEGAEQSFSLVSATDSRFVYDSDSAWIDSGRRSVTLDVDVPGCRTRVDATFGTGTIFGTSTLEEPTGTLEEPTGDLWLGGAGSRSIGGETTYSGGTTKCAPQPTVTFKSYCDGVLHTRLANAPGATVDAVFLADGKRVRVRPGKHADLTSRPSGTVAVRDNALRTHTGSWIAPADCAPAS
ncbi:hypothetical protein [Actinoplanes sp. GCM10030250]|uniref:hypothetical protein n=1 Tax=Actinoplanes sp. GCM10030250 TaxID=3273376 RepID=UPI003613B998